MTEEDIMVGFRGLDWVYDVTTDTNAIAERARTFDARITAIPIPPRRSATATLGRFVAAPPEPRETRPAGHRAWRGARAHRQTPAAA